MAGAYIKYLDLDWEQYLNLYNKQNIKLLNKSKLPMSFTKHENNIANTLTISQQIIDETEELKEILHLLSYGANEPIDDELITKLLSCDDTDIIEALKIGIKLKYIKESSQGYTIHRLLKEVWKSQEELEQTFINSVATNLSNYIYEIKDEFLNLSKIEIANLFSEQWINYLSNNDTKAILIAYIAYLDYYKGNYENALKIVNHANEIVEKKDSKEYADILSYQANLNDNLGHFDKAQYFGELSFEMRKKLFLEYNHPDIAQSLNDLGTLWNQLKKYKIALSFYEQALEIYKNIYQNKNHSSIANTLNNLGTTWNNLNDYNKAFNIYNESFEIFKKLYPNQDHPSIANCLNNLGSTFNNLENYNQAISFHKQSYEMKKRLYLKQEHPDITASLHNLGVTWNNLKNYPQAINFYNKCFEMRKKLYLNHEHPHIISVMLNLSNLLCKNPITKKKGLELLKQYKKIITKQEGKQEIENRLKKYDNVGRNKSKSKRR